MKYDRINGLNKDVSRMVFGCDWIFADPERLPCSFQALDEVAGIGCNAFDTAHVYCGGDSERALGLWMEARGNRDRMVILTKGSHHNQDRKRVTPFDIESDLHDSFARLRTDYVDILVLHRDDVTQDVGPIVEILNQYFALGKIKVFGGSNWTHQRIEAANEYAYKHNLQPFMASSPNFGLAEQVQNPWGQGCVGLNGPDLSEARDWYLRHPAIRIFAYSSLARGFFSGRIRSDMVAEEARTILDRAAMTAYFHPVNLRRLARAEQLAQEKSLSVAQIAVAFVMNHPLKIFSLQSPRTLEEMQQNDQAINLTLSDREMAWLNLED
jgi:aryl-alcohol dehydrogenase-like predicted oxidoreductase